VPYGLQSQALWCSLWLWWPVLSSLFGGLWWLKGTKKSTPFGVLSFLALSSRVVTVLVVVRYRLTIVLLPQFARLRCSCLLRLCSFKHLLRILVHREARSLPTLLLRMLLRLISLSSYTCFLVAWGACAPHCRYVYFKAFSCSASEALRLLYSAVSIASE
jgi:hypothetical protein